LTKEDALIRPLRDEADYEAALARYERYFDREPEPGTPEGDHFGHLGMVIAKYEAEHFPFEAASEGERRLIAGGRSVLR
jgi:antitoxin component HigA of HigAB toxin-antitoxin module